MKQQTIICLLIAILSPLGFASLYYWVLPHTDLFAHAATLSAIVAVIASMNLDSRL